MKIKKDQQDLATGKRSPCVYIIGLLRNEFDTVDTCKTCYIGHTVNHEERLKMHNKSSVSGGGAWKTVTLVNNLRKTSYSDAKWVTLAVITGFSHKGKAESFEHKLQKLLTLSSTHIGLLLTL